MSSCEIEINEPEKNYPCQVTLGGFELNRPDLGRLIEYHRENSRWNGVVVETDRIYFMPLNEVKFYYYDEADKPGEGPYGRHNVKSIKIRMHVKNSMENTEMMKAFDDIYREAFISFQCNTCKQITTVLVLNCVWSEGSLKDGYDNYLVLQLLDYTNGPPKDPNYRIKNFRQIPTGEDAKGLAGEKEMRAKERIEIEKKRSSKGDTTSPENESRQGNTTSPENEKTPPPAPTVNDHGSDSPKCHIPGPVSFIAGSLAGIPIIAGVAAATGVVVYYASPAVREWVDDRILGLMNAVIYGTVTDEQGEPVPGAQLTFRGTKNQQDKTTAAGTEENGKGDYKSPHLYPDAYTITVTATNHVTATARTTAADGQTKLGITLKKKNPE